MADFRHIRRHLTKATAALALFMLTACESGEKSMPDPSGLNAVQMQIDIPIPVPVFRSFDNTNPTHRVNRILLLPFRKTAENLTNDNANFVPVYTYALQKDIDQFPTTTMKLYLASQSTYKVLVIGYNRTDYDFNNRNSPANLFDFGSVTNPLTLDNFCLIPKSAVSIPEFFTCVADVYNGATLLGQTFKPEQGYNLQGTLNRVVSGLSVTITNVPDFVRTITLRAENLVKSTSVKDNAPATVQTAGDGGNRILDRKAPVSGTVSFSKYLLPTLAANKTALYLDVELGSTSQSHQIIAQTVDPGAVSNNQFIFNPNEAINLSGDYSTINLGFKLCYGINLDNDAWDGVNDAGPGVN